MATEVVEEDGVCVAADVLACLSTEDDAPCWRDLLRAVNVEFRAEEVWRRRGPGVCWRHGAAAEAWEALQAADLAPPDDEGRAWWCPTCEGRGGSWVDGIGPPARKNWEPCPRCDGGATAHPPDVGALAAVACIGLPRWLRAEELARELRPGRVVWRAAATAEEVAAESRRMASRADPPDEAERRLRLTVFRDLAGVGVYLVGVGARDVHLAAGSVFGVERSMTVGGDR